MSKTLVALWAVDNTITSRFDAYGFGKRIDLLKDAVAAAAKEVKDEGYDGAMQCIFVGPEYLFRSEKTSQYLRRFKQERQKQLKEINLGSREVLDDEFLEADKSFEMQYAGSEALQLRNCLKELSIQNPRMLIVPGTVSYRKNAWSSAGGFSQLTAAQESLGHMMRLRNDFRSYRSGTKPHSGFAPKTPVKLESLQLLESKIGRLQGQVALYNRMRNNRQRIDVSKLDVQYIVYNSAFVFHNGREVLTYHKQGEVGEISYEGDSSNWNMLYSNGVNKTWRHYEDGVANNTYAVEVCLDAGLGRIQSLPSKVSVQIVPAFGQEFKMIGQWYEKLLIFVDGHPHDNFPVVRADSVLSADKTLTLDGEELRFYEVDGLAL